MEPYSISLGTEDRVKRLFSYPNKPDDSESLADTIRHWFDQTLKRDGFTHGEAGSSVSVEGPNYYLDLPNLDLVLFEVYEKRIPAFLSNGWDALTNVIPKLEQDGKWDPERTGKWRFFLPLGLPMVIQRSLQFFHYPPIRLLDTMQDYLNDPVPVRWEELLQANGVPPDQAPLYETVVDATPIAAPDDQGSKKSDKGDPHWGLIPIQYFLDYQRAQVRLLLTEPPTNEGHTNPIVVYGGHPREIFGQLYELRDAQGNITKLGVNTVATANILPGKKTPVLGANHPYRFYAQAQIDPGSGSDVGSGRIVPKNCAGAVTVMIDDLIAARWQVEMARDPSQDPSHVLDQCKIYWKDPARKPEICALVQHQGSLLYKDPNSLDFTFRLTPADAAKFCRAHNNDPCAT